MNRNQETTLITWLLHSNPQKRQITFGLWTMVAIDVVRNNWDSMHILKAEPSEFADQLIYR